MDRVCDDNESACLVGAPPDEPAPALARDLEVDVAIIGGGFTGVSTAYHLSRRFPDRGIPLVEAKRLAKRARGRKCGARVHGNTGPHPHPPRVPPQPPPPPPPAPPNRAPT